MNKKRIILYILFFIILIFLYSKYIEPYNLIIKEYKIENNILPNNFNGLKIIHFSDVHYGTSVDYEYLEKIVSLINKQKPDIVFFTGDFIDKDIKLTNKEIKNINNLLLKIESTIGNYAVTGNHDMKHIDDYKKILDGSFILLENQEKLLYYNDTTPISLVGISDTLESTPNYNIFDNNTNHFRIVLVHEPDAYDNIKDNKINIMLSGHSHNGQIRIPFIGAIYTPNGSKKYYDNYYKLNNTELFVSNGIGTSRINIRFMSQPSINLYRLYK